jgi:hypothetical protein
MSEYATWGMRTTCTVQPPQPPRIDLAVCQLPLGWLGYDAVIGRDLLDQLRFPYDRPAC